MVAAETAGDAERTARVLAGVRAYQANDYRRDLPPMPAVAQVGNARLLDYGGEGPVVAFVPSLINPPFVLDLAEDNSMLRWLAQHGCRVMLVDWGTPDDTGLTVAGHVTDRLLPLLLQIGEPCALAGYCLGGTMALAAAAHAPLSSVALLATPWHFAGYGDTAREQIVTYWRSCRNAADTLGALPMELLQPMFWQLDPAATVRKFERLAGLDPDSAEAHAFVALEDWANDGPPLSPGAVHELFEGLYAADAPSTGWEVGGRVVDLARLGLPVLNIVSTRDRIVPAAAAPEIGTRIEVDAGHVGMIVGSRARALIWEPLRAFLTGR